jgi:AraC-like DNA-binding protein
MAPTADINRLPLSNAPVLRSTDADEFRTFMARHSRTVDMPDGRRDRAFLANAVYLPNVYVGAVAYGRPVDIRASEDRPDYAIQFRLDGELAAVTGRVSFACSAERAAIGSPGIDQALFSSADCVRLPVSISQDAMTRQLTALLGTAVATPVVFDPTLDLDRGSGRSIASGVGWAIAQLERDGSLMANPLFVSQFEQFIMTSLLLGQPSNYRVLLERSARLIAPRDVKRVIDYIEAHAELPLAVADLVAVAGVSGRTLFQHFRDFKDMSPMAYLRKVRFERVRDELLRADGDLRVTDAATKWGFAHLGRFSIGYRRLFGESPSQTLRGAGGSRSARRLLS